MIGGADPGDTNGDGVVDDQDTAAAEAEYQEIQMVMV